MLKVALSIIGGVVIAFAIVFAADSLIHAINSSSAVPPDPGDREAMRQYVASQPVTILGAVVVGWAVAAWAGSTAAAYLAKRGEWPGWVVATLFFLATAANFMMVSHPMWMVAAGILLVAAAGWSGSHLGARWSGILSRS